MAHGVEPGDRVAIWAPNVWEWIPAALGIHLAGGVLVPLNTRYKGVEAGYILGRSGARVLVTMGEFLGDRLRRHARGAPSTSPPSCPRCAAIVTLRTGGPVGLGRVPGLGRRRRPGRASTPRVDALTPDDLSDILFTSGTTGQPEGRHGDARRRPCARTRRWSDVVGLREGDRYLIVNPFFHAFGYKAGMARARCSRARRSTRRRSSTSTRCSSASPASSITMLPGPPTLFHTILDHPRRRRATTCRGCASRSPARPRSPSS